MVSYCEPRSRVLTAVPTPSPLFSPSISMLSLHLPHSLSKTFINKPFKASTFCIIFHSNCHKSLNFHPFRLPFSKFLFLSHKFPLVLSLTTPSTLATSFHHYHPLLLHILHHIHPFYTLLPQNLLDSFIFSLSYTLSSIVEDFCLHHHSTTSTPPKRKFRSTQAEGTSSQALQWASMTSRISTAKRTRGSAPHPLSLTHPNHIACYTCLSSTLIVATHFYDDDLLA